MLGKAPPRFPLPIWLFQRFGFVGRDLTTMWRWLRTHEFELDPGPTCAIHPEARSVETWLREQRPPSRGAA